MTINNVRFHDRQSNMPIFGLDSKSDGTSYVGLKFENISCVVPITPISKNRLIGTKEAPWGEGFTFKNVTFNHHDGKPPVLLTKDNFKDYLQTNEFVDKKIFE